MPLKVAVVPLSESQESSGTSSLYTMWIDLRDYWDDSLEETHMSNDVALQIQAQATVRAVCDLILPAKWPRRPRMLQIIDDEEESFDQDAFDDIAVWLIQHGLS